jgi:hypothetical protein
MPSCLDFYDAHGNLIRRVRAPDSRELRLQRPTPLQPVNASYRVLVYEKRRAPQPRPQYVAKAGDWKSY